MTNDTLDREIVDTWPEPLAGAWAAVLEAPDRQHLQRVIGANGTLLRFLWAIAASEHIAGGIPVTLDDLAHPSDGIWRHVVQRLLGRKAVAPTPLLNEVRDWWRTAKVDGRGIGGVFDELVRIRNESAHEQSYDSPDERRKAQAAHRLLRAVLASMTWMRRLSLFWVESTRVGERETLGRIWWLHGQVPVLSKHARWKGQLAASTAYLTHVDYPEIAIAVTPWIDRGFLDGSKRATVVLLNATTGRGAEKRLAQFTASGIGAGTVTEMDGETRLRSNVLLERATPDAPSVRTLDHPVAPPRRYGASASREPLEQVHADLGVLAWLSLRTHNVDPQLELRVRDHGVRIGVTDNDIENLFDAARYVERAASAVHRFRPRDAERLLRDGVRLAVQGGTYDPRVRSELREIARATHSIPLLEQIEREALRTLQDGPSAEDGTAPLVQRLAPLASAGAVLAGFSATKGVVPALAIAPAAGMLASAITRMWKTSTHQGAESDSQVDRPTLVSVGGTGLNAIVGVSGLVTRTRSGYSDTSWAPGAGVNGAQFVYRWCDSERRELSRALTRARRWFGSAALREQLVHHPRKTLPSPLHRRLESIGGAWTALSAQVAHTSADLANELSTRSLIGQRPVALVGVSMGACLILEALGRLDDRVISRVVESVALWGAPCSHDAVLQRLPSLVAGPVTVAFAEDDAVLHYVATLDQSRRPALGLAGTDAPDVTTVDLTGKVLWHTDYARHFGTLASKTGGR